MGGHAGAYSALTVEIGDTVVFRTVPGYHDVATVPTLADLESCTMTDATVVAEWDPTSAGVSAACTSNAMCCPDSSCAAGSDGMSVTYTWEAVTAGDVHFVCTLGAGW